MPRLLSLTSRLGCIILRPGPRVLLKVATFSSKRQPNADQRCCSAPLYGGLISIIVFEVSLRGKEAGEASQGNTSLP